MLFPRMPKALLKTPPGFKKPRTEDFKQDMKDLGESIAEEFKETIIDNIETNKYGYALKDSTIRKKGSDIPFIGEGTLVDAIYREGTTVSVEDTPRADSSLTNKELAITLEYGTKDKHIIPRPLWRETYRDFKVDAKEKVIEFFKTAK